MSTTRALTPFALLGEFFLSAATVVGGMGVMLGRIMVRLLRLNFDKSELLRNMYKMGVKSLPIVVVTALFTGGIMVIQAAPIVERYNAQGLLGWGAGFGTLREIGPLLTAFMISGRVGANNTAELGTMVVTEQIDALRALAIDPNNAMALLELGRIYAYEGKHMMAKRHFEAALAVRPDDEAIQRDLHQIDTLIEQTKGSAPA